MMSPLMSRTAADAVAANTTVKARTKQNVYGFMVFDFCDDFECLVDEEIMSWCETYL